MGLIGAISGYKVDFDLMREVAQARPGWSFVLIGEVGEGDPWTDIEGLKRIPNIHFMGPRPYASLPGYLKGMDVAILMNRRNEYTKSMFPMKFFEYLAAGRPVVSCPLDALQDYADVAFFREGKDAFIEGVEAMLSGNGAALDMRLARARQNTYAIRTGKMLDLIDALQSGNETVP